jgi:peptidoglycan hydrolase-like protein with peptidoglycan-binding domain
MRHAHNAKVGLVGAGGALAAVAAWMALGLGGQSASQARSVTTPATAAVIRTNLSSREQVAGTLGYPPAPTLVAQQAAATITELPAIGAVIRRGGMLYEADGQPVRLLYGAHAAWRTLGLGVSDGQDVVQLKRNLTALGYASPASLPLDKDFDAATSSAVERWQAAQGRPATGVLLLGTVAFLPGAVRVSATLALAGAPIQQGTPVLVLSSPELTVSVALDPTLRQLVHAGDKVSIQLPAGNQTSGRVAHVAADVSATSSGQSSAGDATGQGSSGSTQGNSSTPQPTVAVVISLSDPKASEGLDQVPVSVQITDTIHRGVLAVPVGALLALAEGGYAVAVYDHGIRTLIGVRTGVFDGGRVEVSGRGLEAGMRVEVPGS